MNGLQTYDGVVKSVLELRKVFSNLTDREYAAWFEQKYMITEKRVLSILQADKEARDHAAIPTH